MSSKRELILRAIVTTLAGTAGVGTRIYRSRATALDRNEAPAICISPGPDKAIDPEAGGSASFGKSDRRLTVLIAVYTRGAIPDSLADPIEISLHQKLMADRSLGGLAFDIIPLDRLPQMDEADQSAAWMVNEYAVTYRTAIENISAN